MLKTIKLYIHGLKLSWFIGILDFEYERSQIVVFDIDMDVVVPKKEEDMSVENIVCYKSIVDSIKALREQGHVRLVETLAHRVAHVCLRDRRVVCVSVKLSKPNAVPEAENVGVIIKKRQEDQ